MGVVDPLTSILTITSQFESQSFYNHGAPFPASKIKVGTTWRSEIAGVMTTDSRGQEFTIRVRFFDAIMSTGLIEVKVQGADAPYKVTMSFTCGFAQIAGHLTVTIDEGKNNLIEKLFTFNQPFNVNTAPWSVSFQWAETGNELVS